MSEKLGLTPEIDGDIKAKVVGTIPTLSPVLFMPALHGKGATLFDRSTNANHGTIIGALWRGTIRGLKVLDFDGSGQRVTLTALNLFTTYSISCWFKTDDITFRILLGQSDNSSVYVEITDATTITVSTLTPGQQKAFTVPVMAIATWYHFVWTRAAGSSRVYLNGVESTSGAQVQLGNTQMDEWGRYWDGSAGESWDGQLGLFIVTLPALSAAQVLELYTRQRRLFGV